MNQHWDLVRDAGVILNEGGSIGEHRGRPRFFSVSLSEKVPLPIRLVATGTPGHGSAPRADSAVNRLVAAVHRIVTYQTPFKVLPEVQRYYESVADTQPSPTREQLRNLTTALQDPATAAELTRNITINARVRNTISVTMLQGSNKVRRHPARGHGGARRASPPR